MHPGRHAWARAGAGGKNKVGYPDFPLQCATVEALPVLSGETESRNLSIVGKLSVVCTARKRKRQGPSEE